MIDRKYITPSINTKSKNIFEPSSQFIFNESCHEFFRYVLVAEIYFISKN